MPETPAEAIVLALTQAGRSLSLAELVELAGVAEIDAVDVLPVLLRAAVVEPEAHSGQPLTFRLARR